MIEALASSRELHMIFMGLMALAGIALPLAVWWADRR